MRIHLLSSRTAAGFGVRDVLQNLGAGATTAALVTFVAALVPRLLAALVLEPEIVEPDDAYYFLKIADNVAAGRGFVEGHLLAYRPPLYPLLLAFWRALCDTDLLPIRLFQACCGAATCLLVYLTARRLFGPLTGLLAGLGFAFYPQHIYYSTLIMTEQLFTLLLLLALFLAIEADRRDSLRLAALCGLATGLAILTRESGILLPAALLLGLLYRRRHWRSALRPWLPMVAVAVLVVSPWIVRNTIVFDRLWLLTTNSGINFYIGNNDQAPGHFDWRLPPGAVWNQPCDNGELEIQATMLGFKHGLAFIADHPDRALALVARRAYYLFRPPFWTIDFAQHPAQTLLRIVWSAMYLAVFLLAFLIAPALYRRFRSQFVILYGLIVALALPYLLTFGATRFRLPLEPLMTMLASVAITCRAASKMPATHPQRPRHGGMGR